MLENIEEICIVNKNSHELLTLNEFMENFNVTQFVASYYITGNEEHQSKFLEYIRSNSEYNYDTIQEFCNDPNLDLPSYDIENIQSFIRNGSLEFEEGTYFDYLFISVDNQIISTSECKEDYTAWAVKQLFDHLESKHNIKIFYKNLYN